MNFLKTLITIVALIGSTAQAAIISWSELNPSFSVNDTFILDVVGSDFFNNVDGGGVNIGFDASVLNVLSVSINESVWDFGSTGISTGEVDNILGTVEGVMVNAISNVSGDFTVASIEFQVVAEGSSFLSLTEFGLNPWASGGSAINPDFSSTTVNAVPVPAAIWLFGSGLLGLVGMARRKA